MLEILAQTAGEAAEAAGWESSLLLAAFLVVLGLVLMLAEVFFISFGMLTLCSIASFVGGIVIAFNVGTGYGVTFIIVVAILIPVIIAVGLKVMPRTGWGRILVLGGPKPAEVTGTAAEEGLEALVGKEGRTMTMCRPAGMAEIDGERCDVVSEGLTILEDRPVKVIEIEGNRIVVRELDEDDPPAAGMTND